ncbi:MAG TPA: glutamate--tRNA ligase [Candidatus Faecisoma merdavium]|nr:glutamate--tRNA ligase [Candidatus Faecisoma merdavium]
MKEYADLLLPNIDKTIEDYKKIYPNRNLSEGAIVTRYAPSPTGYVHMGALFSAFIASKMAKQTNGVFFLRIEDTDKKREIENGVTGIIKDLKNYGIKIDEGMISESEWIGQYGPYIQSKRKEIYQTFAKHLIMNDLAYPCFCTEEDLENIRKEQESIKDRIGYYGKWARDRYLSHEEVIKRINNGEKYVIRLKSPGKFENKVIYDDLVKGKLELPENALDIIIIKGDGLPTYHFAHLVDDYLMGTTHIIRGDEWLSSVPIHLQLFKVFGFKPPKYAHISPLLKEDNGTRRKLSKRKDPEAAISYYHEKGIPVEAVLLYLCTVANSNFEMWYLQNKDKTIDDFKLEFKKISASGSLFDVDKLLNISKNYISLLSAIDVYNNTLEYSKNYDNELFDLLTKYKDYSINVMNIEREQKKPRKDLAMFSDFRKQNWYMYDELFNNLNYEWQNITNKEDIKNILNLYISKYDVNDDKDTWFNKMKEVCDTLGYASDMKAYKENPNNYKGNIADVSNVLRVSLTTKSMTPDLYEIMKLLGKERMEKRFNMV